MRDEKRVVTLNDYEQRLMVRGLTDFRNDALRDGVPTEDVEDLILKVIDAPMRRGKRRYGRRTGGAGAVWWGGAGASVLHDMV